MLNETLKADILHWFDQIIKVDNPESFSRKNMKHMCKKSEKFRGSVVHKKLHPYANNQPNSQEKDTKFGLKGYWNSPIHLLDSM